MLTANQPPSQRVRRRSPSRQAYRVNDARCGCAEVVLPALLAFDQPPRAETGQRNPDRVAVDPEHRGRLYEELHRNACTGNGREQVEDQAFRGGAHFFRYYDSAQQYASCVISSAAVVVLRVAGG